MELNILIFGIPAVVLTGILVETAKRAGVPTKYLPVLSLLVGAVVIAAGSWSLSVEGVVAGINWGAAARGFVSKNG